jgi:glyoxylase-like metal-dependent hydrolase (beta-lactamase superfamily II)
MKRTTHVLTMALIVTLGIGCAKSSSSQASQQLPDYVPLLPDVKAKAPAIDPQKGYVVQELKPNIYMITEGAYESVFITTDKGVVLIDAPPSFAKYISQAVAETTAEPIVMLVYTHLHVDHIGGASVILAQHPKIQILAEEGTAEFLQSIHDPHRPLPTTTFKDHYTLKLGTLTANMKLGHWHTPEGDLLITIPDKKVVVAIDAFSAGATPFMDFDLTMNMDAYLKFFDQLEATDFDILVAGHHSTPATKQDLAVARNYVNDVVNTMAHVLAEDRQPLKEAAVRKYGSNGWAVASVLMDDEINECARQIKSRWIDKLEGVDIWAPSHCRTALVYDEWDVGSR